MGLWEGVWILPASKKLGTDGCPTELGPSPVCTFTKAAAAPTWFSTAASIPGPARALDTHLRPRLDLD